MGSPNCGHDSDNLPSNLLPRKEERTTGRASQALDEGPYEFKEVVEGMNAPKETGNVQRTLRTPSSSNTSIVQCYNCSGKGHYARNYTHVPDLCAVEKLARNAYQEAEKQRIFAQQVQTQNTHLTSQLEMYKERVRILENINKDNNYLNEFLEADERAKHIMKSSVSLMEKLEDENVSLDFKVQSLIKERDNAKMEYKKLFDSIKKTRSQTQKEMDVVQIVLWVVDSGCSKHMTGDQSLLRNFIEKFIGTVRFGNDNFTAITGYGDYIQAISYFSILDLVDGLPKFKYGKDHLCSACERGKSKKASHPPKLVPSDHSKLELLHMDLCGPMRIIKKFIAQAQLNYKAKVCKIRTDNGTEFKNTSLKAHYEKLGIMQQFSIARTPQQNGVVERRNRTLVEAARTMLIFSWLPEFL
ncbi:retrovirus-related pol polyprotein from transposon TNT 1-94 [Tanacetum coccineum]